MTSSSVTKLIGRWGYFDMKGNIPIPELKPGEEMWLAVVVTSVRERRTQQGESFHLANGRNASGSVSIKVPSQASGEGKPLKPGLWGVVGRLETFQNQPQIVLSEYRPITVEKYRELQGAEPALPRAYTLDIETIAQPEFRERAALKLRRASRLGKMRPEQQERYDEAAAAEEEEAYRLGSLAATSGRIVSIAVHVGPVPEIEGSKPNETEHVFGIAADGLEQPELQALRQFLTLMSDFDSEIDEIVGHNVLGFDLPFIFQRCLVNNIAGAPFVNLSEYNPRGVYDTMLRWWLGSRNRVSLDDLAWALGLQSSKTEEVDGSLVFDLYQAGKLAEIREYNLNDVRLTRKVYERMVAVWGR
ncbi:MAG TPA: ribonuclease H-like domain-containing protein [Blastocatellia bacterium]|nr:ribonuclease H-like domain-containing protein [Blastocatellia bacterium]